MADISAGDLRTKVRIQRKVRIGTGSFANEVWVDLGNDTENEPPKYIYSMWEGAFGSRAFIANSVQASKPAEVTIRFRDDVTEQCRVIKDGVLYDIISPHDMDQRKQWLTFEVKASVNS